MWSEGVGKEELIIAFFRIEDNVVKLLSYSCDKIDERRTGFRSKRSNNMTLRSGLKCPKSFINQPFAFVILI